MSLAFWILWIIVAIFLAFRAARAKTEIDVVMLLLLGLFFVIGCRVFGWPYP